MARDFVINGECLASVKFGMHQAGQPYWSGDPGNGGVSGTYFELGLTDGPITVSPTFRHRDFRCDDFGPEIPVEVLSMMADVRISMNLIHYDDTVLDVCIAESLGNPGVNTGVFMPSMRPLGQNRPRLASGCHYISLNLSSPVLTRPWRFWTSYLLGDPVEFPLGTEKTVARVNWRAVPYRPQVSGLDVLASGAVLWDRQLDT